MAVGGDQVEEGFDEVGLLLEGGGAGFQEVVEGVEAAGPGGIGEGYLMKVGEGGAVGEEFLEVFGLEVEHAVGEGLVSGGVAGVGFGGVHEDEVAGGEVVGGAAVVVAADAGFDQADGVFGVAVAAVVVGDGLGAETFQAGEAGYGPGGYFRGHWSLFAGGGGGGCMALGPPGPPEGGGGRVLFWRWKGVYFYGSRVICLL
jgi:hypothetical protein